MADQGTVASAILSAAITESRRSASGLSIASGTVLAAVGTTATVQLDGDTPANAAVCQVIIALPTVGSRVLVLVLPSASAVVLGKLL